MTQELYYASGLILALIGVVWAQLNRRMNGYDRQFAKINNRCMIEVGSIATVSTKIDGLADRMERVENKVDDLSLLVKKNGTG